MFQPFDVLPRISSGNHPRTFVQAGLMLIQIPSVVATPSMSRWPRAGRQGEGQQRCRDHDVLACLHDMTPWWVGHVVPGVHWFQRCRAAPNQSRKSACIAGVNSCPAACSRRRCGTPRRCSHTSARSAHATGSLLSARPWMINPSSVANASRDASTGSSSGRIRPHSKPNPATTVALRPGVRRPGVETSRPNVARAGTWTDTGWPATMESAIRSGRRAAQHILSSTSARVIA